jgi:hypothetical protein
LGIRAEDFRHRRQAGRGRGVDPGLVEGGEDALRGEGDLADPHAGGVGHRVGDGGGGPVDRDLGDGLGPEGPRGLVGRHEDRRQLGGVGGGGDRVVPERAELHPAMRVEGHALVEGVAEGLQRRPLHLALGHLRVDDLAAVHRLHDAQDAHEAGLGVHLDLHEHRGEGRRRLVRHVGGGGHDLELVLLVERGQAHLLVGHEAPVLRAHLPAVDQRLVRRDLQHLRADLGDLLEDEAGRLLDGVARDVRGGRA